MSANGTGTGGAPLADSENRAEHDEIAESSKVRPLVAESAENEANFADEHTSVLSRISMHASIQLPGGEECRLVFANEPSLSRLPNGQLRFEGKVSTAQLCERFLQHVTQCDSFEENFAIESLRFLGEVIKHDVNSDWKQCAHTLLGTCTRLLLQRFGTGHETCDFSNFDRPSIAVLEFATTLVSFAFEIALRLPIKHRRRGNKKLKKIDRNDSLLVESLDQLMATVFASRNAALLRHLLMCDSEFNDPVFGEDEPTAGDLWRLLDKTLPLMPKTRSLLEKQEVAQTLFRAVSDPVFLMLTKRDAEFAAVMSLPPKETLIENSASVWNKALDASESLIAALPSLKSVLVPLVDMYAESTGNYTEVLRHVESSNASRVLKSELTKTLLERSLRRLEQSDSAKLRSDVLRQAISVCSTPLSWADLPCLSDIHDKVLLPLLVSLRADIENANKPKMLETCASTLRCVIDAVTQWCEITGRSAEESAEPTTVQLLTEATIASQKYKLDLLAE
ncbi:MAG: hypothetical protein MHM6MM_006602, partial [Cercozoa sp. M6MM]